MNVDDSVPGRIVYQPENEYEYAVLRVMLDALKGRRVGRSGGLTAYFTAEIPEYSALDDQLYREADHWKDVGYRALVVLWREPLQDDYLTTP